MTQPESDNEIITGFSLIKDMSREDLIDELLHWDRKIYAGQKNHDLKVSVANFRITVNTVINSVIRVYWHSRRGKE